MSENKHDNQEKKLSRRSFLKNAGLTVGGLAVGGVVGSLAGKGDKKETNHAEETHTAPKYDQALMYFNQLQFQTIEAASEQIFPKTEVGPGAKELLVAYYIDHQLAGKWGQNSKEYMSGPFLLSEAVPEQGYQTHLKRHEIFDLGIEALNNEAAKRSDKEDRKPTFKDLTEDEQIEILKDFESDKVALNGGVNASFFFKLLRQATIEGVYADPMYGGNKDMAGWKMKNFPGHQMSMKEQIQSEKFIAIKPQSLNSQHNH